MIVMKFGGAAVKTPKCFSRIADLVAERKPVVVVVSAMGDMTNQLIELAGEVSKSPPKRELDMLVSVGERISMSLLAMALAEKGVEAVSFTGSQAGIITSDDHTNARIIDVKPHRLLPVLEAGKVAVVAGFQGMSSSKEITTLGRGGSDMTAVALGVALGGECVEFYKDVEGIYDDYPHGKLCPDLSYAQAIEIAESAAHPVLDPYALHYAKEHTMPLHVRSFLVETSVGTWVRV